MVFLDKDIDGTERWYIVEFHSGSVAVVFADDLMPVLQQGFVKLMVNVSLDQGSVFEATRAAYMSANHRIKAGESGGVG